MKNTTILTLIMSLSGTLFAQNVPISGGIKQSSFVGEDQKIYVWGANNVGQLGLESTGTPVTDSYKNTPINLKLGNVSLTPSSSIGILPAMKKVDAGAGSHLLALSCTNQLWAWGGNENSQLGRTNTPTTEVPSRVLSGQQDLSRNNNIYDPNNIYLDNIIEFSGGAYSSYAVEEATGFVLAWGDNAFGQLGDGTVIDRSSPVYVLKEDGSRLSNIVAVEAGEAYGYALDASGNVWSWGQVSQGGGETFALGRSTTATINTSSGGTTAPRAGKVTVAADPLNPGFGNCATTFLSNIVEISAGYGHCLALDKNGNVWSFGGDWGNGQLGRGGQSVYVKCANRVVAPGVVKTTGFTEIDFLGNGVDGKAVSISAGQASSAVVLANGKVVTFGSRGVFTIEPLITASGSINCGGTFNTLISSGILGDGNGTCNSTVCETSGSTTNHSKTPVYVKGIPTDEKIIQISDGDAWYFAVSATGKVYTWGWNRRGELGVGDYLDKCQATLLPLPASISLPCHTKPDLGPDLNVCPVGISQVLNSGIKLATSTFNWYYTQDLSAPKILLNAANAPSYTATQYGYYIVEVSDSRSAVSSECGPCKIQSDTIKVQALVSPYLTSACFDQSVQKGIFSIDSPANTKVKWYLNPTDVTPLNFNNDFATITSAAQQQTVCNGQYGLFAEDITSYGGAIIATGETTPTNAQIAAATGCTQGGNWNSNEGMSTYLMIEVTAPIKLTSLSFLFNAPNSMVTSTNKLLIYNNNPTANICNTCNPPKYTDGKSANIFAQVPISINYTSPNTNKVVTVPMELTLPIGKYWIGSDVQWHIAFNCNRTMQTNSHLWQTPFVDSRGILKAVTAYKFGNYITSGAYFDIKYETGTSYACPKIPVCVSSVCVITETSDALIEENLSLSPNPNKGNFTLSLPSAYVASSITIFDAVGHVVYEGAASERTTEFDLQNLESGIYTVKVQNLNNTAVTRLVIE